MRFISGSFRKTWDFFSGLGRFSVPKTDKSTRGEMDMNESELYKELGILTKDKSKWEKNLQEMAENSNRVVRIHSLGAIKATTAK